MKAAVIHEHGGVDKMRIDEVPRPKAAQGEALLQVRAAALNHLDVWVRRGGRAKLRMPHVLGSDAAGTVAELGPGASAPQVGDAVILNPGLSCGSCEFCNRGEHSLCASFGLVGLNRPGTYAEFVAVPAANLLPKPPHLSFQEAAALPMAHATAWRMLMARAGLRAGETVLIHGIGGGIAQAGLQLARLAGAEVVVTSSSDEKLRRAKELGAHHAINYKAAPDVAGEVRKLTGGRGADVVMDTVGAATWETNFAAVRKGGRIVHCGVTGGAAAQVNVQTLYWNQIAVMGSTLGSREDFRAMLRAVIAAGLKPVIDSVLPLDEARKAAERMEGGGQFGKIVLTIA